MLSRNEIKQIRSLHQKKFREIHRQFIAEGSKLVLDLISGFHNIHAVYAGSRWIRENGHMAAQREIPVIEVSETEMKRITALTEPSPVLAVAMIPETSSLPDCREGLTLVIDEIKDPGNLGTIIRIADWFGISQLICSESTVDLYNPKVIQATMGSISRIRVYYASLKHFLAALSP
jgi:RNA methyltransferase, TrmH family